MCNNISYLSIQEKKEEQYEVLPGYKTHGHSDFVILTRDLKSISYKDFFLRQGLPTQLSMTLNLQCSLEGLELEILLSQLIVLRSL
jgi:hypothetical protein